jgi:hypothetical protein
LGYPEQLKGEDIPIGARIISVADAFDAITTDRPYQKGRTFKDALAILKEGAGTKWDFQCVAAFERIIPKIPSHKINSESPKERLLCLSDNDTEIVLEPGPLNGARLRWIKPGVDFSKYRRLILDRVIFFFAEDSEYKGVNPQELKKLGDVFNRTFKEALKEKYPIVKNPAPDVARIRFAITDLRQNRPVLSDLGPTGAEHYELKMRRMESWSDSGATSAEMMVLDSMTNSPIGAARDDRRTALKERFTKWGDAEDAFKYWADRLRLFLDQARMVKR